MRVSGQFWLGTAVPGVPGRHAWQEQVIPGQGSDNPSQSTSLVDCDWCVVQSLVGEIEAFEDALEFVTVVVADDQLALARGLMLNVHAGAERFAQAVL
jgi:hypothetical protein